MQPGFILRTRIGNLRIGVIYTSHFVERYHSDSPGRPAGRKFASEEFIQNAIREGLREIAGYVVSGYKDIEGIIRSRSKKINMSFAVKPNPRGFTLIMKNMMWKLDYTPLSLKDFVVEVNPKFNVHFQKGLDSDLKIAVLDHLSGVIRRLKKNAGYSLGDDDVRYIVETSGNDVEVFDAGWTKDMLYVDVK
jgi:hypothetical protein